MSIYKQVKRDGKHQSVHRYVWEQANGQIPDGYVVHHINHDKLYNRLANLQLMTYQKHAAHHNDKHARIKTCVICETQYEPHATKRERSQTCSPDCRVELISLRMIARYGKHLVTCARCGTEFRVPRCKASVARFCSRTCANKRMTKEAAP